MRYAVPTLFLIFAAAAALACPSTGENVVAAEGDRGLAATQLDKVKSETKEAAAATRDYAHAQRAELVDKMNRDLVEMDKELELLSAKAEKASGQAKADAQRKLVAAREKWAQAKQRAQSAQSATESSWEDVKASFEESYVDLKEDVEQTRQWLSDKVEP